MDEANDQSVITLNGKPAEQELDKNWEVARIRAGTPGTASERTACGIQMP